VAGVPAGAGELGAILEERPMRLRIISAAVVLGLGLVGITLAQQSGDQSKQQPIDRAKLRFQGTLPYRSADHDLRLSAVSPT
jgi:hypothetical protein